MESLSCLLEIKNRYQTLTPVEKRIADYIVQNSDRVVNMTVQELASHAQTVGSAVLRCCKSLGFSGFPALKISLSADISKNKQLNYAPYIGPHDTVGDILDKVFSANVKTLHDTAERLDRGVLAALVNALSAANHIYIYGIGTSAALVQDFSYRLMQVGLTSLYFTDVPSMKVSTLNIKKEDVAIGISHSGRTIPTIEALRLARLRGAATACITSYSASPITADCDYPIEISSDEIQYPIEAVSARIAHIGVMDTITIALSAKNYELAAQREKETHEFVNLGRYG